MSDNSPPNLILSTGPAKEVGTRFRAEVDRLGGVANVVDFVSVTRTTIYNWFETGLIPAKELAVLHRLGMDTAYVISGVHNDATTEMPGPLYRAAPGDAAAPGDLQAVELERMQDVIQVMTELVQARGLTPAPAKFAAACVLLYELSKQGGGKPPVASARRLVETIV